MYNPGKKFLEIRDFHRIQDFVAHSDVWMSLSRAKFDEEDDFELRSALAPEKPCQMGETRNFRSEMFAKKLFWASKNETLGIV